MGRYLDDQGKLHDLRAVPLYRECFSRELLAAPSVSSGELFSPTVELGQRVDMDIIILLADMVVTGK
jgi:hypothetical protein